MSDTMMMTFAFEGRPVRFVGTAERPEWVAQDVCDILEIEKARNALADFAADEKGARTVGTLGGPQEVLTILEPGLYRLLFRSRKPQAQAFARWVLHQVLPEIRRTGSFGRGVLAELEALRSELAAARYQITALADVSKLQAGALASALAHRGHQIRTQERAQHHIDMGQRLLVPDARPIETVKRAPRRSRNPLPKPTREQIGALLRAWRDEFGMGESAEHVTVVEAVTQAAVNTAQKDEPRAFVESLFAPFGGDRFNVVGQVLARCEGEVVDGLTFRKFRKRRSNRWRVELVPVPVNRINGAAKNGG